MLWNMLSEDKGMKIGVNILLTLALGLNLTTTGWAAPSTARLESSKTTLAYSPELLISRFASWGIDPDKHLASINLKGSWQKFKKNKEVVVAVIDTGIQGDHAFLAENIHVIGGTKSSHNYGVDFSTGKATNTPVDHHGHGTHVAGIVKSVYPDVKILALKYYNPKASGQANLDATIKALRYAVENNVDVINYSGGGPEASVEELRVLKEAEKKGILVIAAAGNERSNIDDKKHAYYPASYGLSNIITVGAHDDSLNIIPSSNYGKNSVDIAAPGHRIRSAIPGNSAGYMTGTSQATAFVSGVAALIRSKYPTMKYDQIKNIILSSSLKVKTFEGKILGAGKLDASRALELADSANQKLSAPARSLANR
jgi:subtilisin family serine protease